MFGFIKKIFIGLLTSKVNASNHRICVSLSNLKCMTQPILINLHRNEYTQGLRYYSSAVNLDRYVRSCNTLNDLSNEVCIPSRTFKSKRFQHDYRNKWIKDINKTCIIRAIGVRGTNRGLLSLRNNKNYRLRKSEVFPLY